MEKYPIDDQAEDALERCLSNLHMEAVALVNTHWQRIREIEASMGTKWEEHSVLQLSSHRKGNHIQMKWVEFKWVGKKGSRIQLKKNIQKSSVSFGYSMAKLKAIAKDWEFPIVKETEEKLTILRRRAQHLVKSKTYFRHYRSLGLDGSINPISDSELEEDDEIDYE